MSSIELGHKKNKLITEFALLLLSEYWVETCWIGDERQRLKESTVSSKLSLWDKWKENNEFQILSLMLKSPVIIRTFWRLASVSLIYFKVD